VSLDAFLTSHRTSAGVPSRLAPDVSYQFDCSAVLNLVAKRKFAEIVADQDLFSLLYVELASRIFRIPPFAFHREAVKINFRGKAEMLTATLVALDAFRQCCQRALSTKTAVRVCHLKDRGRFGWHLFSSAAEGMDTRKIYWTPYSSYYLGVLAELTGSLGMRLSWVAENVRIISASVDKKISAPVAILMPGGDLSPAPWIEAKLYPEEDVLRKMIDLREGAIEPDFFLSTVKSLGPAIPVHKVILFLRGGSVLESYFKGRWSPSPKGDEKEPSFAIDCGYLTLQLLVEYLYRGPAAFEIYVVKTLADSTPASPAAACAAAGGAGRAFEGTVDDSEKTFDLCQLYELAHCFQIEGLMDACANLLGRFARIEDRDTIAHLATMGSTEAPVSKEEALGVDIGEYLEIGDGRYHRIQNEQLGKLAKVLQADSEKWMAASGGAAAKAAV